MLGRMRFISCVIFCVLIFSCIDTFAQDAISEPSQWYTAPYRLFKTSNTWTFIELDTATGKMWQIQFDVQGDNRGAVVLNAQNLASGKKTIPGRFTLYETQNIYTFILLDQIEGRTWQIQWSHERNKRLVIPIAD